MIDNIRRSIRHAEANGQLLVGDVPVIPPAGDGQVSDLAIDIRRIRRSQRLLNQTNNPPHRLPDSIEQIIADAIRDAENADNEDTEPVYTLGGVYDQPDGVDALANGQVDQLGGAAEDGQTGQPGYANSDIVDDADAHAFGNASEEEGDDNSNYGDGQDDDYDDWDGINPNTIADPAQIEESWNDIYFSLFATNGIQPTDVLTWIELMYKCSTSSQLCEGLREFCRGINNQSTSWYPSRVNAVPLMRIPDINAASIVVTGLTCSQRAIPTPTGYKKPPHNTVYIVTQLTDADTRMATERAYSNMAELAYIVSQVAKFHTLTPVHHPLTNLTNSMLAKTADQLPVICKTVGTQFSMNSDASSTQSTVPVPDEFAITVVNPFIVHGVNPRKLVTHQITHITSDEFICTHTAWVLSTLSTPSNPSDEFKRLYMDAVLAASSAMMMLPYSKRHPIVTLRAINVPEIYDVGTVNLTTVRILDVHSLAYNICRAYYTLLSPANTQFKLTCVSRRGTYGVPETELIVARLRLAIMAYEGDHLFDVDTLKPLQSDAEDQSSFIVSVELFKHIIRITRGLTVDSFLP